MIIKKLPSDSEEEELFDSFIKKGGKTKGESNGGSVEEEKVIRFSLRVPESLVNEMDNRRQKRFGNISRNLWIIEAIVNYIEE